jgi:hypothetical protein
MGKVTVILDYSDQLELLVLLLENKRLTKQPKEWVDLEGQQ